MLPRKFGWSENRLAQATGVLEEIATVIEPGRLPFVIQGNGADNSVLECAVAVSADYLVTGDSQHLLPLGEHRRVRILNAPSFLTALEG